MKIELGGIKNDVYSNFVESIRNAGTRRHYTRNLDQFMNLIPDSVFEDSMGKAPVSRNSRDLADAFVLLAKQNLDAAKSIIKSYIREINKDVDSGKLSPNTVANKIKPIKALLVTNDIDTSWIFAIRLFQCHII